MSSLLDDLNQFQSIFSPHLENFLAEHKASVKSIHPLAFEMADRLNEFILRGGKRIRPALLFYGYQGFSDQNLTEILKVGVACELVQAFFLIHDDIMDEALLRRGGETIHKIFANNSFKPTNVYSKDQNNGACSRYGESIAILMGNLAGYLGIKAINAIDCNEATKRQITDLYSQMCIDVNYGQALDLSHQSFDQLSEKYIFDIYRYKTARYTTEFPLLCAGLLANQSETTQNTLLEIGSKLGIIFQIQDDILGMFGDESDIGKSTLSDIAQGKKTILICKAWEKSETEEKDYLAKNYGNPNITLQEAWQVRAIIKNTGALDYAKAIIKQNSQYVLKSLEVLNLRHSGNAFIEKMLDYYA